MRKQLIIFGVLLIAVLYFMVVFLFKNQDSKFKVGDRVSIVGSNNCNCIVNYVINSRVEIVCSSHNGVNSETVVETIIKPCNEDSNL